MERDREGEGVEERGKERGGRVTLSVRRAWCGHAVGEDREARGGGDGSRRAQRVRRMFSCRSSLEVRAAALNPSARWLGSHQIKKSLPHQSFTACL